MDSPDRHALLLMLVGLVFASPFSAHGADEYDRLIKEGSNQATKAAKASNSINTVDDLHAVVAQYEQAATTFREAEQVEPADRHGFAWLFRGQIFNRIGEAIKNFNKIKCKEERGAPAAFCTALDEINHAKNLGMNPKEQPEFLVELGYALLKTGDTLEAKLTFVQFLSLGAGDAKLQEKARSLRDEAEKKIADTDKEKKKIHICGDAPKPFVVPDQTSQSKPKDLGKQYVAPAEPNCPTGTIQSQFLKSLTTGFGYNGNVIPLGNGLPLPVGFPHKDAFFEESTLNLEGDWFFYHPGGTEGLVDKLAATYIGVHDAYFDVSAGNTLLQTGGLSYGHCLNEKTCLGFSAKDAWLRSDTKNVGNILSLQPSISYAENAELTTKFSYSTIRYDYSMTPKQPLAVLDGFAHQLALEQTWAHPINDSEWSPDVTLTAKYLHQWFTTDGIVGDKQRDDPFVKADWCVFKAKSVCAPVRSVNLAASYEYRHDDFENATFPMLTGPNRFKRRDDAHLVDVAITMKLLYDEVVKNRLEAVFEYQSTINDSNVATKAYDQPRFIASLKVNF